MNLQEKLNANKPLVTKIAFTLGALFLGIIMYIIASISPDNSPPLISLPQQAMSPTPAPVRAQMYAKPLSVETTSGTQFEIEIVADANNTVINGIDSVVLYDPTMVKAVRVNPPQPADESFSLMRRQIEGNKVILTTVKTKFTETPSQEVTIARITFQALKPGSTSLSFEHIPGTTTGSVVIQAEGSKNILDKVTSVNITVK